jgi:hypothetical protein
MMTENMGAGPQPVKHIFKKKEYNKGKVINASMNTCLQMNLDVAKAT